MRYRAHLPQRAAPALSEASRHTSKDPAASSDSFIPRAQVVVVCPLIIPPSPSYQRWRKRPTFCSTNMASIFIRSTIRRSRAAQSFCASHRRAAMMTTRSMRSLKRWSMYGNALACRCDTGRGGRLGRARDRCGRESRSPQIRGSLCEALGHPEAAMSRPDPRQAALRGLQSDQPANSRDSCRTHSDHRTFVTMTRPWKA